MKDKITIDGVDVSGCKSFCENYGEYHQGCWEDNEICYLHNNHCSDNPNCYYKQLLAEQAKNKELETTLESFRKANDKKNEFLQQLGINAGGEFNRIKYYIDNLQAKNKKLVEALEKIRWYKAIGKDVHKIQQIAAHAVTGIDVLENGLRGLEVNNAK